MTTIRVETNAAEVSAFMRRLFRDQQPFATSKAINRTALTFQERQRAHQRTIFDVRNPRFVDRSVKIRRGDFATKRKLEAVVRHEPPGGAARADVLGKFETETLKTPFRGRRIAIPRPDIPRTGRGAVVSRLRPSKLDLRPHGRGRVIGTKGDVRVGKHRTVAILKPGARGAIFQRTSRGLELLYLLRPRVSIEPELRFQETATNTVEDVFPRYWTQEFDRAVVSAR